MLLDGFLSKYKCQNNTYNNADGKWNRIYKCRTWRCAISGVLPAPKQVAVAIRYNSTHNVRQKNCHYAKDNGSSFHVHFSFKIPIYRCTIEPSHLPKCPNVPIQDPPSQRTFIQLKVRPIRILVIHPHRIHIHKTHAAIQPLGGKISLQNVQANRLAALLPRHIEGMGTSCLAYPLPAKRGCTPRMWITRTAPGSASVGHRVPA